MFAFLRDRINASWVMLVTASFISWEAGQIPGVPALGVGQLALCIAFAKAFLVGREFMDLRLAPRILRLPFLAWALAVPTLLVTLYSR